MPPTPILEALIALDEEIAQEEAIILDSLVRIEQLRASFMLSHKMKTFNISLLRERSNVARQRIIELKKRKTLISIT